MRHKQAIDGTGQTCVSAITMLAESLINKRRIWGITCEHIVQMAWILKQRDALNHKIVS